MSEPKEHILVADDEPAVLEVCLRILERGGYQASGVSNGQQAMDRFAASGFDLVLSDIKMPDVDGLEVLRRVKEINADTPVVLITGFGNLETAMEAVRYGASGFVLKPFHARDLLHAVEEALAKTRLWRENVRLKTLLPLLEASQALMEETDGLRLAQLVADLAAGLVGADAAHLLLPGENGHLEQVARAGPNAQPLDPGLLDGTAEELEAGLSGHGPVGMAAPLSFRQAAEGCLLVGRDQGHSPFQEGDRDTLGVFARHATAALENAGLFRQIREYAEHLEERVEERTAELRESETRVRQLYETHRQLRISLDLEQIMNNMLGLAISVAGASYGSLTIPGEAGIHPQRVAQGETVGGVGDRGLESRLVAQATEQRAPVPWAGSGEGEALAIPLLVGGQPQAVLVLCHEKADAFTPEHVDLLLPLCSRAAALIANARAFRQTSEQLDQAHAQLQERAKQLEMTTQQLVRADKLAVIGQLAAGISHEMGNIIAPLQVYADLLAGATPGEAGYDGYVAQIQKITERGRNILRQFTDFARKDVAAAKPINLVSVLEQSLGLMSYTFNQKGIAVYQDVPADLPTVMGDPGQVEQVFINIMVNAADAMPQGGSLCISARVHRPSGDAGGPGYVEMRFRDSGVGIEAQDLAHVFEPFFTTKEVGKGTGLGLFICYGIIQRHSGSIDIESEPRQGTTLIIRLPISRQAGDQGIAGQGATSHGV